MQQDQSSGWISMTGSASRRDAQVRHAITRLIRYTRRHGIHAIAVEDLDFADARMTGRETMGRGAASAAPCPVYPPPCSANGSPGWPPAPASNCSRSIPPTAASGALSTGAAATHTSPVPGSRHRDRASRPRLFGPATERCDTTATRGSRRESYQPDRTQNPPGEHR